MKVVQAESEKKTSKYLNLISLTRLKAFFFNQTFQAILLLVVEILIFFSTPLLHSANYYYSSADLTQYYTLTKVEPVHQAGNALFSDPVVAFQPWFWFNREMLLQGKVPLWNPYNSNGMPHLANYQSAVFSLYSLPFYILTFRQALLVSAFMKLFGLGFFTFLYLKKLELQQVPALVGATAFMFAGYQVVWLAWPMTATAIVIPAGFYFSESVFRLVINGARYFWTLVGFSLTLTVGLLAGHPETFYFSLFIVSIYISFRLLNLYGTGLLYDLRFISYACLKRVRGTTLEDRQNWQNYRKSSLQLVRLAGGFSLAGIVSISLAALQLLPFIEYLTNSSTFNERATNGGQLGDGGLSVYSWPLWFIPNLLGNSTERYNAVNTLPAANYNELVGFHPGGLVILLSIFSLIYFFRDKYIRFFVLVITVWAIYVYNPFHLATLLRPIPGLSIMPLVRSQEIWLFSLSCCAAIALNRSLVFKSNFKSGWRKLTPPLICLLLGASLFAYVLLGAKGLVETLYRYIMPQSKEFLAYVPGQIWVFGLTFGGGLLAFVSLRLSQKYSIKVTTCAVVLVIVFLQSGYLLKDYNPLTADRFFYPVTPDIKQLQGKTGNKNIAFYGSDIILPDTNIIYKLSILNSLDALWVYRYDRLLTKVMGAETGFRLLSKISEGGLKLFGVEYVAALPNQLNGSLQNQLAIEDDLNPFKLYHYKDSLTKYYTLSQAEVVGSEEEAFSRISQPDFDPYQAVILNGTDRTATNPTSLERSAPAQVLSEKPDEIQLKVTRFTPGYLIINQAYYPGWKVQVNGQERSVLQANYAFNAVEVGPGESYIRFYYDPLSFKLGLFISLVTFVLGMLLIGWRQGMQTFNAHKL